ESTSTVTPGFAWIASSLPGAPGHRRTPSATASDSTPRAADRADAPRILSKLISPIRGEFRGMRVERAVHPEAYFRALDRFEHASAERIVATHHRDRVCAPAARQY